jgi:hypothetical protein
MLVRKKNRCGQTRGQTVVEYILLCSLLAASVLIFQAVFSDSMKELLTEQSVEAQAQASLGGKKSVHEYYVGAEAKTSP